VYRLPVAKQRENTNACIKMLKLYFADIKQLAIAEHFTVSNFKFCTNSFIADYVGALQTLMPAPKEVRIM
jgi:hypothetical protein